MSQNALPMTLTMGSIAANIQRSSCLNVQRKARPCPIENRLTNLAPLRLCWYFNDNDPRFVTGRICKRNA
jgi:hypothetical protein